MFLFLFCLLFFLIVFYIFIDLDEQNARNQIIKTLAASYQLITDLLNPSGMCEIVVNQGCRPRLTTFSHIPEGFNKSVINLKPGCQLIVLY